MSESTAQDLCWRGTRGEIADIGSRGRTSVYAAGAFVLKVFLVESDKPDRELAGLRVAAGTSVRVPRLVWHGELGGHRAVLLERLDGTQPQPRFDREWIALSHATGEVARALHVPVSAFGAWSATPFDTISDLIASRIAASAALARRHATLDHFLVDRCERWTVRRVADLASTTPVLIHRDLSDRNVFGTRQGSGWDLSAVIDFESSGGGLPEEEARWPALLELGGLRPPGTLAAFAEGIGATPDEDVLAVFIVDLAVDIMSYAGHRNPLLMEAAIAAARATAT